MLTRRVAGIMATLAVALPGCDSQARSGADDAPPAAERRPHTAAPPWPATGNGAATGVRDTASHEAGAEAHDAPLAAH